MEVDLIRALASTLLVAGMAGCIAEPLPSFNDDDDALDDDDATDDDDDVPPAPVRSCDVIVEFTPDVPAGTVEVAGEFNNWTPTLLEREGDDGWTIDLGALDPGEYAHKFLTDDRWEGAPPKSAYAKWVDGFENRALRVGDCRRPLLTLMDAEVVAGSATARLAWSAAVGGSLLDIDSVNAGFGETPADVEWDPKTSLLTLTADGLPTGKHSLRVTASDEDGVSIENGPLWHPLWSEEERWDWRDALIYFAFTDRFRDGDGSAAPIGEVDDRADYQGGDFLGILDAMGEDWFTDLGANVLWLSPVYDNPEGAYIAADNVHQFTGFHGYWPVDGLRIESRWGDAGGTAEERLRELIEEAHRKGIRVMFDLVLNHVHEDHAYVRENPQWFTGGCTCGDVGCGWEERPIDCRFMPYLPDLDYKNHQVLQEVVADTLALVRNYDVDAVRVDAAKHMDHVIMTTLAKRLRDDHARGGAADFYLVGETFTGGDGHRQLMEYVDPDELDGQFDFPLFWETRNAFVSGGSFRDLDAAVLTSSAEYGDAIMSPFAGNHDIPRIATEIAGNDGGAWGSTEDLMAGDSDQSYIVEQIAMALAFTMTQPGAPLLYYGDEIGLAGSGDPDNRRMMSFGQALSDNQRELLERTRAVGQARAGSKALRRGERTTLWVDDDLYVYLLDAGEDEVAIVALNKSGGPRTQLVSVQGRVSDGRTLTDSSGRGATVADGSVQVDLGARDYSILK